MRCLEVGTGSGIMSQVFNHYFQQFITLDVQDLRIEKAKDINFQLIDSIQLPFSDASFDFVIHTHVYQYINQPDKHKALGEIHRVLRPGGTCYFATTNKYALVDPHFNVPLLGYLPSALAGRVLKWVTGRYQNYEIYSDSYRMLQRRLRQHFLVEDLTMYFIKNYQYYQFDDVPAIKMFALLPEQLLKLLMMTVITNWIMWLKKDET